MLTCAPHVCTPHVTLRTLLHLHFGRGFRGGSGACGSDITASSRLLHVDFMSKGSLGKGFGVGVHGSVYLVHVDWGWEVAHVGTWFFFFFFFRPKGARSRGAGERSGPCKGPNEVRFKRMHRRCILMARFVFSFSWRTLRFAPRLVNRTFGAGAPEGCTFNARVRVHVCAACMCALRACVRCVHVCAACMCALRACVRCVHVCAACM